MITKTFKVSIEVPEDMAIGRKLVDAIYGCLQSQLGYSKLEVNDLTSIPSNNLTEYEGLKVGQTFNHRRSRFTIVGFNPNKPKNCVQIQNQNGKDCICSVGFCNMLIDGTAPSNW